MALAYNPNYYVGKMMISKEQLTLVGLKFWTPESVFL